MNFVRNFRWVMVSIFLVIVLWEIVTKILNSPLLPSLRQIWQVAPKVILDFSVYSHLSASVVLVLKGFGLSVLIALPTSLMCFRMRTFSKIVLPAHEFVRYIPVPAFVPLCAAVFGIGDTTKVVLIFIGTYFQLILLFIADFTSQPKEFEDSARTLGLKGLRLFHQVTIPASLANLLNTVRITFAWAWSYLLVAEVVNASRGIGYLLLQSYRVLNMERLIILLIIIGIFGILTDTILKFARQLICPWIKDEKRKTLA